MWTIVSCIATTNILYLYSIMKLIYKKIFHRNIISVNILYFNICYHISFYKVINSLKYNFLVCGTDSIEYDVCLGRILNTTIELSSQVESTFKLYFHVQEISILRHTRDSSNDCIFVIPHLWSTKMPYKRKHWLIRLASHKYFSA